MNRVIKNPFERVQKGAVVMLCIVYMMFFIASGCGKSNSASGREENGENPFYYYEGKKIPLKQIKDKIFIQFANPADYARAPIDWEQWEIDWEQWSALIKSDATLQIYNSESSGSGAILEAKDGNPIQLTTIEYFKVSPVVASVSYVLENEHTGVLQGLTNEFMVKLKETTSYLQLAQLVEQNHCIIEREDNSVNNLFYLAVPKTSELNAMQTSNLFCETNLFEDIQPIFVLINNTVVGNCGNKIILKVLDDELVYVRKSCFQHLDQRNITYIFELENDNHPGYYTQLLFPLGDIPKQYREEGLSVYISGNIISCLVMGCSEPNIRVRNINAFELKSIKINK